MKKFTKISLITAAILTAVGAVFIIAALCLGLTLGTVRSYVTQGAFNFPLNKVIENDYKDSEDMVLDNETSYDISKVESLKIDLGVGSLSIEQSKDDKAYVDTNNSKLTEVKISDDSLKIDAGLNTGDSNTGVVVYIPKGMSFHEVKIDVGAGQMNINALLDAEEYDINVGAGELSMLLPGVETDYDYALEVAIGQINVGSKEYAGFAVSQKIENGNTDKEVKAECGAGQINISFEK